MTVRVGGKTRKKLKACLVKDHHPGTTEKNTKLPNIITGKGLLNAIDLPTIQAHLMIRTPTIQLILGSVAPNYGNSQVN